MSFIFHSEVDPNLQFELNYRGNSGKTRSTDDIDFMVGKIANVQITAYESGSSDPNQVVKSYGILGYFKQSITLSSIYSYSYSTTRVGVGTRVVLE